MIRKCWGRTASGLIAGGFPRQRAQTGARIQRHSRSDTARQIERCRRGGAAAVRSLIRAPIARFDDDERNRSHRRADQGAETRDAVEERRNRSISPLPISGISSVKCRRIRGWRINPAPRLIDATLLLHVRVQGTRMGTRSREAPRRGGPRRTASHRSPPVSSIQRPSSCRPQT